ncbi:uroporphyrinogen decarboxylase family protein [Methanomethylophilus alvi]|uniref:uroporphyrinogen decarboxylase family protein n=1 Tax=Methanomethylophilus alvi TaxID=1291540 RepID=UPI0037DD7A9E
MVKNLNHLERAAAALADEEVDRLATYPIACGVSRRLIGDGSVTYREWCQDPEKYAEGFVAAQKAFDLDFSIGLMDLSVLAGDLGSHVRFDEENTPFVDKPLIKTLEDYEKLEIPDITKGRTNVIIKGSELVAKRLGDEVITSAFVEGPLLVLSQSAGAEKLFFDSYEEPETVKKALRTITEYDRQVVEALGKTGTKAICWDYLWANYSCLDDKEYGELEGDVFAPSLNEETRKDGMAVAVHNCADLPHLDTQIRKFKPAIYSMAYYPLIEGSKTASQVIEEGYADETLVAGNLDPQIFEQGTVQQVETATKALCQEVKTALCKRGLKSRYCIASGCEVPPSTTCRLENIKAVSDAVKKYGTIGD